MKMVIAIIAVLAITGCSSAAKKDTTAQTETTTPATTTASSDATPAATETKKAKMTETSSDTSSALSAITGTEKSAVTCTNKSDTRKITVLNVTEGGCGVVYNKMGEDKTVAVAKSDMNYCESVSSKIKANLEGAGFNCGGATGTSSDQQPQ